MNAGGGALGTDRLGAAGAAPCDDLNAGTITLVLADRHRPLLETAACSAARVHEEDIHRPPEQVLKIAGHFRSFSEPGGRLSPAQADRAADEP
jgi:hypothetical protein